MAEPLPIDDGGLFGTSAAELEGSTRERVERGEPTVEVDPTDLNTPLVGILTNRWNLVDLLSRRLLLPREALRRGFPDLFDRTPGSIPVVETPLSGELVDTVTYGDGRDQGQCFPVFVQLAARPHGGAVALPVSAIERLHFRSEADLENFTYLSFSNLPSSEIVAVSPGLFDGGSASLLDVGPGGEADTELVRLLDTLDRQSGAALACAAVSPLSGDATRDVAALLDRSRSLVLAPWLGLVETTSASSSGTADVQLATAIHSSICEVIASGASLDDADGFVASLSSMLAGAGQMTDELDKLFSSTLDFVNGEADLPDFKFAVRAAHKEVVRGLLMFLLRKDVEHLIPWAFSRMHATEPSLLTAAYYSGFRRRRTAMDLELRPEVLDTYLAAIEGATIDPEFNQPGPIDVELVDIDGRPGSVLRSGAEELLRIPGPMTPLAELVTGARSAEAPAHSAILELVRSLGWMDLLTSVVSNPPTYTVDPAAATLTFQGEITVEVHVDTARLAERLAVEPPEESDLTQLVRQAATESKKTGAKPGTRRSERRNRPAT
jgi:hypothetical protein